MTANPVALLKEIAKKYRKKVRSTNLFDTNVCTSPANPERPWEVMALPRDIFRHKLGLVCNGFKVTLRANGEFLAVEVSGSFDVPVCSINRRDKVFCLEKDDIRIPHFPQLPVFTQKFSANLSQLLRSMALQRALEGLQLRESESIHICRNRIVLYSSRASRSEVLSAVGHMCDLAKELPALDEHVDLSGLPIQFRPLSRLIGKWAVSDDEARSEMIDRTPRGRLESFVASVSPHVSAINEYLDSLGDEPLDEAAIALESLAQCALEAQIRLDKHSPVSGLKPK